MLTGLNAVRIAVAVSTVWLPCESAIVDLIVIEGEYSACPEGYTKAQHSDSLTGDFDQWDGDHSRYIWLCVKDGTEDDGITDLAVVAMDEETDGCGDLDGNWHRITAQQGSNGDFNHGASGSAYVYLCYEKNASKAPLTNIQLEPGNCPNGMFRIQQAGLSNGDFNQGAGYGSKYIFMCASRGCKARAATGKWVYLRTLSGDQKYTLKHGTTRTSTGQKSESWSLSVSATVSTELSVEGPFASAKTSVSLTTAQEQSASYSSEWSWEVTTEEDFEVDFDKSYEGKALFQWQFFIEGTCSNTNPKTQDYALTDGTFAPPKCLPGYQTCDEDCNAVAAKVGYQTCRDPEHTLPEGKTKNLRSTR